MALESVATILERTALTTIQDWYELAVLSELLIAVPMSREQRCAHLPRLLRDLVFRLRSPTFSGTKELGYHCRWIARWFVFRAAG
jgi:hypothetical protein